MVYIDIEELKGFSEAEWDDFFDGLEDLGEVTITEDGEPVSVFLSLDKANEMGVDMEEIEELHLDESLGGLTDEDFYGYSDD